MYPQQLSMYYTGSPQYDLLAVPLTPLDMTYSHSMIPSNLLVGSPYFINSFPMSPQIPHHDPGLSSLLHLQAQAQAQAQVQAQAQAQAAHAHALHMAHVAQSSHPLYNQRQFQQQYAQNYQNGAGSQSFGGGPANGGPGLAYKYEDSNLDSLCLSRTVILKNLLEDLTLQQVLDAIDFGPIEYVRMFKKTSPPQDESLYTQTCHISFLNSKISINFHLKYGKNKYNLNKLRTQLDSKNLRISLSERLNNLSSNGTGKLDFIKLKTLNYVMDLKATRSIVLKTKGEAKIDEIRLQLEKFGEIEKLEIQAPAAEPETEVEAEVEAQPEPETLLPKQVDEPEAVAVEDADEKLIQKKVDEAESEQNVIEEEEKEKEEKAPIESSTSITVHFVSIDAAIRCYEFYVKRIQNLGADSDIQSIAFTKDRCDRPSIESIATSQPPTANSTTASSPVISRRNTTSHSNFLPNESIISIPEDDSFGSEGSEFSEFNPLMLLENNEAIRKSLMKRNGQVSSTSSSSEGEEGIDEHERIPRSSNSHSTLSQSNRSHSKMSQSNMSAISMPYSSISLPMIPPSPNMAHIQQMHPQFQGYSNIPDQFNNLGNRTIYLGNLHPNTTVEDIANNVRAGGIVQSIKHHPEKKVCFITFIDPLIALKFFLNHEVLHQLVIHGYDVTVGWAKNHSGPLNRDITLAVTAGASRNVYIGIKPTNPANDEDADSLSATTPKMTLPDEQCLRRDFSKFGELEQINFYHNKDCGFLNFLNISDAIKLVDCFGMKNVEKVSKIVGDSGEFYEKYSKFKISFAKDRCGNPPKFNIRKKAKGQKKGRAFVGNVKSNFNSFREGDLYESDIVNELRETSRIEEEERKKKDNYEKNDNDVDDVDGDIFPSGKSDVERGEMTEEAALVFGIISKKEDDVEDEKSNDVKEVGAEMEKENGILKEDEPEQDVKEPVQEKQSDKETEAVLTKGELDNSTEDEEDEDDEEDEVSIIINSEDISTSSIISDKSSPLKTPSKPPKNMRSIRRSNSDVFMPKRSEYSRNSSNISLNSSYGKNGYYYNHLNKQSQLPQQVYQQSGLYYMSPQRASPSGMGRNGGGSATGSISGSGPNGGYFNFHPGPPTPPHTSYGHPQYGVPPMPHPLPYHHLHQVNMLAYGPPSPYHAPHYSSQPHLPSSAGRGGAGTSGSQVMAQYLAQSQHENMLYAAAMYNNGMENEDENYHYKGRRRHRQI